MQKFNKLSDVIALAEFAHRNQVDKAGMPYIEHPKRVMQFVQSQGALPYVQMGAVLHDVIEDTPFTARMLIDLGVPKPAVDLVELLTRTKDVSPDDYYAAIEKSHEARMIKLADIHDNTLPWRLSYLDESTRARLSVKYAKARIALNDGNYVDRKIIENWENSQK